MDQPGNHEEDVLAGYAREYVRREIVSNLGKLANGHFTPQEIADMELEVTLDVPGAQDMDEDICIGPFDTQSLLSMLPSRNPMTDEERLAEAIEELEDSGGNEDIARSKQARYDELREAVEDFNIVHGLMAEHDLDEAAAIEMKLDNGSDISFTLIWWKSSYEAAKKQGFEVLETFEEWAAFQLEPRKDQ